MKRILLAGELMAIIAGLSIAFPDQLSHDASIDVTGPMQTCVLAQLECYPASVTFTFPASMADDTVCITNPNHLPVTVVLPDGGVVDMTKIWISWGPHREKCESVPGGVPIS